MNSDLLIQLLHKGFRVTLGATASLIEILQDPQRRDENLGRLRTDLAELADEWAVKGELTEQEARNFVETILAQQTRTNSSSESGGTTTITTTATTAPPAATPDVQNDLRELTDQIAAIRAELEKLREES
jgi:polyhydroxyalkanoate synthesis regulator phasin